MDENPRCSLKIVYSCFDCHYFVNKSSHIDIKKEKYTCMVEKKDFSFMEMSPDGVPAWCPLPLFAKLKKESCFPMFQKIMDKLEKGPDNKEK